MGRPLSCSLVLAAALVAIGCSEKETAPLTGPDLHTGLTLSSGCDVQHIDQLANSYFSPPRKQAVKTLVDLLATQLPHTVAAKNSGFDIMAQIEGAVNDVPATAGDPTVGSDLVNHLLLCMYNPGSETASYPASFPDTFTVALTPSLTGAFGHRSSGTDPVYARSAGFTLGFSGIAPAGSWGVVPALNNPARVVFYGRPATTSNGAIISQTYDWRTIPHNATFSPEIVIAICIDAAASSNSTVMLNEQGVGILAFVDAAFLDPASCAPTNTALLDGSRPFQLARRLVRFGTDLLTPRLLMATALSPGGIGGSNSRCCSQVGPTNVPSVALTLSNVTTPVKVNSGRFSLTATTTSGTDLVNGTKVTLLTSTNNGTNTSVRVAAPGANCSSGTPPQGITGTGTNPTGTYVFTNLCFTNTGSVFILGTANIEARSDTPATKLSNKINVKP
jgi:hypothetical protein